jgi:outer membrane protein assembly factor BamB
MRRFLRILTFLGAGLALVVLVPAVLIYGFGMRLAMDGSGTWAIVSFDPRDDHFKKLERQRTAQRAQSPAPPTPVPSAPDAPAPTPAAEPATDAASPTADARRAPPEPTGPASAPVDGARSHAAAARPGWSEFRGTRRDGVYQGSPIRLPWPQNGPPLLWKQPIGEGYASFAIASGRAFTIEQRRGSEVVAAYEVDTGRELWTQSWEAEFREGMGGDGPRATPTWHDGRVYALGATGELRCLRDADGTVLWRRDILDENGATNLQWGMASSPIVVDDKVIVLPGGRNGRSVVAYHRVTGAPVWSVLDDQQAYTAPMVVTLLGARQLLVVSASRAMGVAIDDGALLWEYPWVTQSGINVAQPIVLSENRVFVSAGYGHGAAVIEVSQNGSRWETRTVWQNTRMKNRFASSILHEGHVYGLDEGILACVDVATGDLKWKGGRYGHGQVIAANGYLIVLTERGELALVRATPDAFQELGVVPAIEGKTWNHPALADGRLLVRNAREMAAFDLRSGR